MEKQSYETRIDNLLDARGLHANKHVAVKRFREDFKVYTWYYYDTDNARNNFINFLEQDSNLISSSILENNFQGSFVEYFIPVELRNDNRFMCLVEKLILSNGKGVGIGELLLPLLVRGYQFSNESDGVYYDRNMEIRVSELKNNGASIKPIKTGITDKGLVDRLNKEYFNGYRPGARSGKDFQNFLNQVTEPEKQFSEYFSKLYPTADTTTLTEKVLSCYDDKEDFIRVVGQWALREYQKTDRWDNLTVIDPDTLEVVNISDPTNLENLSIKFTPKFIRGKDTQAISDGYVNMKIS